MTTFTPPVAPSNSSTVQKTYRFLQNDYGDGYKSRGGDGLNDVSETWNLVWNTLTKAECDAIMQFLDLQKGVSNFAWETPEGTTKNFTCTNPQKTYNEFTDYNITATFIQDFNG